MNFFLLSVNSMAIGYHSPTSWITESSSLPPFFHVILLSFFWILRTYFLSLLSRWISSILSTHFINLIHLFCSKYLSDKHEPCDTSIPRSGFDLIVSGEKQHATIIRKILSSCHRPLSTRIQRKNGSSLMTVCWFEIRITSGGGKPINARDIKAFVQIHKEYRGLPIFCSFNGQQYDCIIEFREWIEDQ